jgi:hypothetical protein
MTLSDISSIVGVISGLAVLGSLIYLAQQTRQNAKHTRALIQSGMASDAAMMRIIFSIPGYRAAWTTTQRQFGPRFRDYVDALMLEQKSRRPRRDASTAWKAHVLEELALPQVATTAP